MVKYDEGFKQRVVYANVGGEGGYVSTAKYEVPSKSDYKRILQTKGASTVVE